MTTITPSSILAIRGVSARSRRRRVGHPHSADWHIAGVQFRQTRSAGCRQTAQRRIPSVSGTTGCRHAVEVFIHSYREHERKVRGLQQDDATGP
jgi:hypothetical protein